MAKMIEVLIDSVRVSLTNQQRIVVLREANAERYLPIWIGPYEAESITIALQDVELARPQTHDLLKNVFTALNARILRVEVISLRDDVFYGNIVVEVNGHEMGIDSRPSDALALAVRAHVPILVSREVMDSAGIIPEQDIEEKPASLAKTEDTGKETQPEASEEHLEVFEDFLQKLDLDNLNSGEEGEGDAGDEGEEGPRRKK
jgi:bifunctional DNase/RNase